MKTGNLIYPTLFLPIVILLTSLGWENIANSQDGDGNVSSNIIRIGNQHWMTQNLDVSYFRNGDPISHAQTDDEWYEAGKNGQPAWCYYDNTAANAERYGKLYNWYAVNDSRGLAPEGWHVPNNEEWNELKEALGGMDKQNFNFNKVGIKMKSTAGWDENGNGSNETSFSGLPAGYRSSYYYDCDFKGKGCICRWWGSTASAVGGYYFGLSCSGDNFHKNSDGPGLGYSVRCIQD